MFTPKWTNLLKVVAVMFPPFLFGDCQHVPVKQDGPLGLLNVPLKLSLKVFGKVLASQVIGCTAVEKPLVVTF
jgi:hypothetical protein